MKLKAASFLVVPDFGLGDAIISLQTAYKLRVLYPDCSIDVICWGKRWADAFRLEAGIINRVLIVDPPFDDGKKKLSAKGTKILTTLVSEHEFIVSLSGSIPVTELISSLKGEQDRFLWKPETKLGPTFSLAVSRCVNALTGAYPEWNPRVAPVAYGLANENIRNFLKDNYKGRKLCLIAGAAGSRLKSLTPEIILKTYVHMTDLGFSPLLLMPHSDEEAAVYRPILASSGMKSIQIASLADVFDVICSASLFIGPDTGLAHFAARKGIATIVLMGPSNVWFGPDGNNVAAINYGKDCEFQNLPCDSRDACSKTKGRAACMDMFKAENLNTALAKLRLLEGF